MRWAKSQICKNKKRANILTSKKCVLHSLVASWYYWVIISICYIQLHETNLLYEFHPDFFYLFTNFIILTVRKQNRLVNHLLRYKKYKMYKTLKIYYFPCLGGKLFYHHTVTFFLKQWKYEVKSSKHHFLIVKKYCCKIEQNININFLGIYILNKLICLPT